MTIIKKLFGAAAAGAEKRGYAYRVRCARCGEILEGRLDLDNDLSVEYEQGGDIYHARKVLMGSGKCFQRLESTFKFTSARTLIERHVSGGEFV